MLAWLLLVATAPTDGELSQAWLEQATWIKDCRRHISLRATHAPDAVKELIERGLRDDAARFIVLACALDDGTFSDSVRRALDIGPIDVVSETVRPLIVLRLARGEPLEQLRRDVITRLSPGERAFVEAIDSVDNAEKFHAAFLLSPTSDRAMCLAGAYARHGRLEEALEVLPKDDFATHRRIVEAIIAANRGEVLFDHKTLQRAHVTEEIPCFATFSDASCVVTEALLRSKAVDAAQEFATEARCGHTIQAWAAEHLAPFEAYVEHFRHRWFASTAVDDDELRESRLLVKLGRVDLARAELRRVMRHCGGERCERAQALLDTLPEPVIDRELVARLAQPPMWKSFEFRMSPKGPVRPSAAVVLPGDRKVEWAAYEGKRGIAGVVERSGNRPDSQYWLLVYLSDDAGVTWDGPWHTGLGSSGFDSLPRHFSFRSESRAPVFVDDVVQLPIAIQRIEKNVPCLDRDDVVRIPLALIRADSDRDSLSDLLEERLATDPRSRDTDRDGISDADDVFPLEDQTSKVDEERFRRAAVEHAGVSDMLLQPPSIAGAGAIRLPLEAHLAYARKFGVVPTYRSDVVMSADRKRAVVLFSSPQEPSDRGLDIHSDRRQSWMSDNTQAVLVVGSALHMRVEPLWSAPMVIVHYKIVGPKLSCSDVKQKRQSPE